MRADTSLVAFRPDASWFAHRPYGIHGLPHVTRVLVWSAVLAERIGEVGAIRWRELFWAASVHDVARVDDGIDQEPGARAARWVEKDLPGLRPATAEVDLKFVAELCFWHQAGDHAIERLSLELLILKDADGLDRCRIGDLDPNRLRFQTSLSLVAPAERLERATSVSGRQGAVETLQTARAMFPEWLS